MKIKLTTILILFTLISGALGIGDGAVIDFFNARAQEDSIKLEWRASSETNLKHYILERRPANGEYIQIAQIQPNSKKLYSYIDNSLFKTTGTFFSYQLKIVDNNNVISKIEAGVTLDNLSGVKRTWGSIKAMFR